MSFLNLKDRNFLITGVANKKSIAYFVAKTIREEGGNLLFSVQSNEHKKQLEKLFPELPCYVCDVSDSEQLNAFSANISQHGAIHGVLHSIAFANYADGIPKFHETKWDDFSQATQISSFSLGAIANALKPCLTEDASFVTLSVSNTRVGSYGYMGVIKACLEASVGHLAKSFSDFSKVRFNAVGSGPLKTAASAGIPGYIDNYLFSEKLTLRKANLKTQEVANTCCFLLSDASSGINGSTLIVDAGMSVNYFDEEVVSKTVNSSDK